MNTKESVRQIAPCNPPFLVKEIGFDDSAKILRSSSESVLTGSNEVELKKKRDVKFAVTSLLESEIS